MKPKKIRIRSRFSVCMLKVYPTAVNCFGLFPEEQEKNLTSDK
jgi:hypothetical protein